jgi:hypothetical protein
MKLFKNLISNLNKHRTVFIFSLVNISIYLLGLTIFGFFGSDMSNLVIDILIIFLKYFLLIFGFVVAILLPIFLKYKANKNDIPEKNLTDELFELRYENIQLKKANAELNEYLKINGIITNDYEQ